MSKILDHFDTSEFSEVVLQKLEKLNKTWEIKEEDLLKAQSELIQCIQHDEDSKMHTKITVTGSSLLSLLRMVLTHVIFADIKWHLEIYKIIWESISFMLSLVFCIIQHILVWYPMTILVAFVASQ
ncbi:hypothetical protein BDQ17DRAFT_1336705 [Cyathus striatus]|nr:hypothetical protein BDQ17DRAFT_1336705 [Cyathus striatus]